MGQWKWYLVEIQWDVAILIIGLMFHVIDVFAESVTDSINFIVSWDENCEVVMTMLPLLLLV